MDFFQRINYIANECKKHNIPYEIRPCWDGFQIRFSWCHGDVACHSGTYSANQVAVESMGFPWDEGDVSIHLPEEMAQFIIQHWEKNKEGIEKQMATIKDVIDIYQISDTTLKDYINELTDEVARRKKERRNELINEFKQALRNLNEAGVEVYTETSCLEYGDEVNCIVAPETIYFD